MKSLLSYFRKKNDDLYESLNREDWIEKCAKEQKEYFKRESEFSEKLCKKQRSVLDRDLADILHDRKDGQTGFEELVQVQIARNLGGLVRYGIKLKQDGKQEAVSDPNLTPCNEEANKES